MALPGEVEALRQLEPRWNRGMIAASIAISLLGAFTSTQLMCQAKISLGFHTVLVWTVLGSLTFGFCSIWSLHFVAMLAYELDILIGINVPLTILSSILSVVFTFAALGSDLLWDAYTRERERKTGGNQKRRKTSNFKTRQRLNSDIDSRPLLNHEYAEDSIPPSSFALPSSERQMNGTEIPYDNDNYSSNLPPWREPPRDTTILHPMSSGRITEPTPEESHADITESSEYSVSGGSSSLVGSSSTTTFGLNKIVHMAYRNASPAKNMFIATGETLYTGWTWKNVAKGFLWSLAITSMHYAGLGALSIPDGFCTLNYALVVLSAIISWLVCVVGCILMSHMETHLGKQFLFSAAATTGVTAMHFTGMQAATFWSRSPPNESRGYPPALATAIVSIAIATCMAANGLLAHSATVSRNKLAEIVWTRKKLWRTIAQKENAEAAAAARSDFIASASHEIRTPLHHLQGYSDLLSQTELTEEGRLLLCAIQRATKTLSLITNNVLDWSKLERDSESVCRPVSLDIRTVCESILVLLPNKDDEAEVEIMVVVKPDVPKSIFLDETYIHRILMNLLSNALKFTTSGYILLLIEVIDAKLIATVRDTGPGVPPSFLPQLFEPFKQAQTRGAHRGTGLGLSIVKQLLHNMNGSIEVESKHPEVDHIEPGESGSTFTITIPVQSGSESVSSSNNPLRVALLHGGNERSIEGLHIAWQKFGFETFIAKDVTELVNSEWKYIWADLPFLKSNPACLQALLKQDKWLILVPYDAFLRIPELESATQFILLPRPLIWHTFLQRITLAQKVPVKIDTARMVRFASNVDFVDQNDGTQAPTAKGLLVLLVEDNPINQKLGQKMLQSLGYKVQIAQNGQEAIDQLLVNNQAIDMILMDQSMPVKDGITATREIREMEALGKISKRRPIIAVTAVVNSEAQALFKQAGANDFLAKPLSLAKLKHTMFIHQPGN